MLPYRGALRTSQLFDFPIILRFQANEFGGDRFLTTHRGDRRAFQSVIEGDIQFQFDTSV